MTKRVSLALVLVGAFYAVPSASAQQAAAPTFNKDVAPIRRKHANSPL